MRLVHQEQRRKSGDVVIEPQKSIEKGCQGERLQQQNVTLRVDCSFPVYSQSWLNRVVIIDYVGSNLKIVIILTQLKVFS